MAYSVRTWAVGVFAGLQLVATGLPAWADDPAGVVTVVGTMTDEGAECPALRGDDGKLYTLTPRDALGLTATGARIRVEGTIAEISTCQQGTTIEVRNVETLE